MATLKEVRNFIGMTQAELAEKVGISIRQLQRIETGETPIGNIAIKNIRELEKILGVTLAEMGSIDLSIFGAESRMSVKNGDLTLKDLMEMNNYQQVKMLSQIGSFGNTFYANYKRIPASIIGKLSLEDIAALVDAFYQAYSDGKSDR